MKKRIVSVLLCATMVLTMLTGCGGGGQQADGGNTQGDGTETTKIKVAAIETAYGADMWKQVAEAFTAETGIEVELITDKNLEDVIGPSMQGGDYPDVVHLATGRSWINRTVH